MTGDGDDSDDGPPNVVYVLADDLGYGDLGCYNDESQIPTPNLDRLAAEGRRFTDAHAPSAVCTPTRYSVLTGRYCRRTDLDSGVLWPWDPPLIDADRLTVPEFLGERGYETACVGKWHLGWDWATDDDRPASGDAAPGEYAAAERGERAEHVDFDAPVRGGPTDRGFDRYFGDDVPNFPPYTYVEDDRVVERPSAEQPDGMEGIDGPAAPGWTLEQVMPDITARAVEFVEESADEPFFLYVPLTAPHTPVVPAKRFQGQSDAGTYGDYVCEVDWAVGQVLDALERRGIADDTLVVFTSDNGPEHLDGHPDANAYDRVREHGHASMGGWRGIKRDLWEGGHRVPFVARWPGEVPAGTDCDETICQTDLFRTLASVLDADLPADAAGDSYDVLPALRGTTGDEPIHDATVYHAIDGSLAVRVGDWVFSDAESADMNGEPDWFRDERGDGEDGPGLLYDLSADPEQRENLHDDRPDVAADLRETLARIETAGRSVDADGEPVG
jgi:arylsulfatase A-like enzyme